MGYFVNITSDRKESNRNMSTAKMNQFALPLSDDFYAESYGLRKAASTMTQAAVDWLSQQAKSILEHIPASSDRTFSVLSVGSGEGDIDFEFINALTGSMCPHWEQLEYTMLEPNATQYSLLTNRLQSTPLNPYVEVTLHQNRIEDVNPDIFHHRFDLILFVHVFYYFDQPEQVISKAMQFLKSNRSLMIIIHQTPIGIPKIQQKHMLSIKGNEIEMFTTKNIRELLDRQNYNYCYQQIDAHLDITDCLQETDDGLKIMSFCMECDLRQIDYTPILKEFMKLAEFRSYGCAYLYEPIGIFTIKALHEADLDPVEDYRQLAQRFNWGKLFLNSTKSPRILDVGSGSGRWLNALHHYVPLNNVIEGTAKYDALDPSYMAIDQLRQCVHYPLQLNETYITSAQKVELPALYYDIVWSNHAFYAVPVPHIPKILSKIHDSLKPKGVCVISLANRRSFYVNFYDQYLKAIHGEGYDGFTSSEKITDALIQLDIPFQVQTLEYTECIQQDDISALAHYIINESTNNSFSRDEDMIKMPISPQVTLQELMVEPSLRQFIDSYKNKTAYYFPQEVQLITFGKLSKGSLIKEQQWNISL